MTNLFSKVLAISIIIASLLTGCTLNQSTEDIMKPPKLSINQEEIRELVKDVLDSNAKLVSPLEGTNNSAIHLVDLDNDKKDEILVFYILENDENPLRGLVITKKDEEWKIDENIKGLGYDFDNIEFADITGDGQLEIVVSWNIGERFKKGVSVYKYKGGDVEEIFNNSYEALAVADMDNDSKSEVFLVKLNRMDFESKGELYRYEDGGMELVDEVKMDGGINGHYNVQVGLAAENKMGIFLDAGLGAHSSETELIVMEDGELKNVFYNEEKEIIEKTFRSYSTLNEDIDNDGIIEIPLLRQPIGHENTSMAGIPWINSWYKWDGKDDLKFVSEGYHNVLQEYYFSFPDKWDERITIDRTIDEEKDERIFSYIDKDNKKYRLFTLISIDREKYDGNNLKETYIKVDEQINKIYFVDIANDNFKDYINKMKLTLGEIKDNFSIKKMNY